MALLANVWRIFTGHNKMGLGSWMTAGKMIVGRFTLGYTEYVVMAITVALVVVLKQYGMSDIAIFFVLWTGNIVFSTGILVASRLVDITLMRAYRRGMEAVWQVCATKGWLHKSLVAVWIAGSLVWFTFWLGPAYVTVFFEQELRYRQHRIIALIILSGVQMGCWSILYLTSIHFLEV